MVQLGLELLLQGDHDIVNKQILSCLTMCVIGDMFICAVAIILVVAIIFNPILTDITTEQWVLGIGVTILVVMLMLIWLVRYRL